MGEVGTPHRQPYKNTELGVISGSILEREIGRKYAQKQDYSVLRANNGIISFKNMHLSDKANPHTHADHPSSTI